MSNRSKYRMTDAAAKRISDRLMDAFTPGSYVSMEHVERALREENFWGENKHRYVTDLCNWMVENGRAHFAIRVAERYIREYYELRAAANDLESGLMKMGIIPYPEDD